MLEAYMLLAEDRIRRNTARKEGFYEDFTSSDGLLLDDSNNPNALSVEEINKQYAVLEELVTTLWSAAICFEAPIWQNMAKQTALTSGEVDNSILGLSTEAEMHETLLYRSIYDAVQEAKVGSIRSALIPEEGRDNGLIDGVLALSLKDLLGHGVTENEQASLVHVVKVCMHSAVRDALAERQ